MTTRYIFPLLMLMTFICSCENEIDFNKAARPPKLIMNALINADSTNNILYLNKTFLLYTSNPSKTPVFMSESCF